MKRNAQQTQEKILSAATVKFAGGGFAGARIDEIAEESGVNKRMIYHYFGDKQGLYEKVLITQMKHMYLSISLPPEGTPEQKIKNAIHAYLDYCQHHPSYISLMMWEMVSGWESLNRIADEVEDGIHYFLVGAIVEGMQQGIFYADLHPRLFLSLTTAQIFCFFPMLQHPHLLHDGASVRMPQQEIDKYKKLMVDHIMRSLKPGSTSAVHGMEGDLL
ncbi:TetR/AcrR family transcriptional regulator [Paenibacillus senegalensis]|uniref:TetR/AcrR family transcriptional regulator n=1 Tax=Paenibacillus senegalensis TaxID=1465766 RepID=UPI0002892595|nr:TetR/AcrR family transcriptional regulator [Paenibacillus senegalensis]